MMNLFRGSEAPWIRKGFDLLMMKKNREALETFAQGLAKEPKDPLGWLGRGMAVSRLGDDRKALEFFDYALRLAPGMGKVWFRKGISLARLGRHEQALPVLLGALEHENEGVRLHAVNVLDRLGEKARPALSRLLAAQKDRSNYVCRVADHAVQMLRTQSGNATP